MAYFRDLETRTIAIEAARGHRYRLLRTVDEAFEVMLQAIHQAQRTIWFEVYIYRASPIGETFREALIAACRRGVRVRVLVDALGSISLPDKFWTPLTEAGGEFRWFNPLKLKRLGFRNHRKVLVCDERIAFIGGFNVAPEYQGDGLTRGWHDLGMEVPATIARELAASSESLFGMADLRHRRFTRLRRSVSRKISSTGDGQLIVNGPGRGSNFMMSAIMSDLARGRTAQIISAYFLPPRYMRRALMRLAKRGGRVQLILPGKSDVLVSQLAARRLYSQFLRAGIEIYEYQPQILHTKLFIIDDVVYGGSANLDKRSLTINYELLVRVQDKDLAADAREFFAKALEQSKEIDVRHWRKQRTFWNKLREYWAFLLLSRIDPYIARWQLRSLLK